MERSGTPVTPHQEHVQVKHMTNGEALVKKVWVGMGKAVESQSPKAWEKRIIRVINDKIIPKLSHEQLSFVSKHKKVIEGAITGASIGISSLELIAVVAIADRSIRKIQPIIDKIRLNRALKKKYPYKSASYVDGLVAWASDPRSESITSSIAGPAIVAFGEKYGVGTDAYKRFGKIMNLLQFGSLGMDGWGLQQQFQKIYEGASSPVKSPYAKYLKPLFKQAFKDVANREGWVAVSEVQKLLMDAEAERLFRNWKNLQFKGLPEMILAGRPWGDLSKKQVEDAVLRIARTPKDFWLLSKPELVSLDQFLIRPPPDIVRMIRKEEEKRKKAVGVMKKNIHEIAARTPDRIKSARRTMEIVRKKKKIRDAFHGSIEDRIRYALQARFPKNEPLHSQSHAVLVRLLATVKQHEDDPEIALILRSLSAGEKITKSQQGNLATRLFAKAYGLIPLNERDYLGFHNVDAASSSLAGKWVQTMSMAALDVLGDADLKAALVKFEPKKKILSVIDQAVNGEFWSWQKQARTLLDTIRHHMDDPEIRQAVETVGLQGAWRQSDDGTERTNTKALSDLVQLGLSKLSREDRLHFGPHDTITKAMMADAIRGGKNSRQYLAFELADLMAQHRVPGLSTLYTLLRKK